MENQAGHVSYFVFICLIIFYLNFEYFKVPVKSVNVFFQRDFSSRQDGMSKGN